MYTIDNTRIIWILPMGLSSWHASETFSTKLIVLTSCELFPESFIFIDKLSIESLEERRKSLCLKFARKCLQVEKLKKLFPRNVKIHKMLKRGSDKFKVNRSLTTRYRNSAIPQMQRMLKDKRVNLLFLQWLRLTSDALMLHMFNCSK